jgi:type IV secretion system protein VirB4
MARCARWCPHGDLGHHLPFRRVSFGEEAFEWVLRALSAQIRCVVSIKDYPGHTLPGMFDELYRMPFEMTVSQSFAFVEQGAALGRMNLALRRMRSAEDEALSLRGELTRAKDDVAAGRAGFGEHHTTTLHADSLEAVDAAVAEVTAVLADLGIVGVREDIALEPAFWAQFPGNFRYIARKGWSRLAISQGWPACTISPWAGRAATTGARPSRCWKRPRRALFLQLPPERPGQFHHHRPLGFGQDGGPQLPAGAGAQIRPRIVFFDKDRGAELFIRAIGGQYDRLRPARPRAQPAADRGYARQPPVPDRLADHAGRRVSVEEAETIRDAVDANFGQPAAHRRLRYLIELYRGHERPHAGDLWSRMRPGCWMANAPGSSTMPRTSPTDRRASAST